MQDEIRTSNNMEDRMKNFKIVFYINALLYFLKLIEFNFNGIFIVRTVLMVVLALLYFELKNNNIFNFKW